MLKTAGGSNDLLHFLGPFASYVQRPNSGELDVSKLKPHVAASLIAPDYETRNLENTCRPVSCPRFSGHADGSYFNELEATHRSRLLPACSLTHTASLMCCSNMDSAYKDQLDLTSSIAYSVCRIHSNNPPLSQALPKCLTQKFTVSLLLPATVIAQNAIRTRSRTKPARRRAHHSER